MERVRLWCGVLMALVDGLRILGSGGQARFQSIRLGGRHGFLQFLGADLVVAARVTVKVHRSSARTISRIHVGPRSHVYDLTEDSQSGGRGFRVRQVKV